MSADNPNYIFRRFKRKPHSEELMDAHDYGYKAWKIPIR